MFKDFIYLDTDRIPSIIAQLQEGLVEQAISGETEQANAKASLRVHLLAFLLPASASGSVEHGRGTNASQSKVLHDYAFEEALTSLREGGLLLEADDFDRDEVPEGGFVLVQGNARITDHRTLEKISANFDKVDKVFSTKTAKRSGIGKQMKDINTVIDTFFKDTIRVNITNARGCEFVGPLRREHLREDIRDLIYKYSSAPPGEWVMLANVARVPDPEDSEEDAIMKRLGEVSEGAVASQVGKVLGMLNGFQELLGTVSYPEVGVSPIAVYRRIKPHSDA